MHIILLSLIVVLSFTSYSERIADFFQRNFTIISRLILLLAFTSTTLLFIPEMVKDTGERALDILWFLLFLPILARVFGLPIARILMRYRKELGIFMGMLAIVHSTLYLAQPYLGTSENNEFNIQNEIQLNGNATNIEWNYPSLWNNETESVREEEFEWQNMKEYILPWDTEFWINNGEISYLGVGMIATFFTFLLLITSNRFAMRFLGKYWKPLHRTVYIIVLFTVLHVILLKWIDIGSILLVVIYFTGKWLEWSWKSFNIMPNKINTTP